MSNKTILTVDDEERVLQLINDILSTKGYDVLTAMSKGGHQEVEEITA